MDKNYTLCINNHTNPGMLWKPCHIYVISSATCSAVEKRLNIPTLRTLKSLGEDIGQMNFNLIDLREVLDRLWETRVRSYILDTGTGSREPEQVPGGEAAERDLRDRGRRQGMENKLHISSTWISIVIFSILHISSFAVLTFKGIFTTLKRKRKKSCKFSN